MAEKTADKELFSAECKKLIESCIADLKSKSNAELCRLEALTDDEFAIGNRKVSLMTSMEINKKNEVMVAVEVSRQTTSVVTVDVTAWADGFAMDSTGAIRELTEEEFLAMR